MRKMWFGTEGRMRWITTPNSGADVSPQGWNSNGTLLNGGGYAYNSFGAHKQFQFAWSDASAREAAQTMQSYANGTFGRGLIYFIDPLTADTNILPAHWADPSLTIDGEAPALIRTRDIPITAATTSNPTVHDLPARSAVYNLANAVSGFPGPADSLFIPVPPGYKLAIGAMYSRTGSGGVFAAPVNSVGTAGTPTLLSTVATNASIITPNIIEPGTLGIRIWVGKSASGSGTVTLSSMTARLTTGEFVGGVGYGGGTYGGGTYGGGATTPDGVYGPWIGGQGHSGCRFIGRPTYINISGINGGQVGYAATLKEVGSWMVG